MDIKQDPNSIPSFNSGSRVGELQQAEPEQIQSSVELDPGAGGDGGASDAPEPDPSKTPDASTTGKGAIDGLVGAP
jgi:hypothetical protein